MSPASAKRVHLRPRAYPMAYSWCELSVRSIAGTGKSLFTLSCSPSSNRNYEPAIGSLARVYSTPKALWKLNWFLRDFGYDMELLGRDEIDDKNLVGLSGVVKISHAVVNGTSLLNLQAFAPANQWKNLASGASDQIGDTRAAS